MQRLALFCARRSVLGLAMVSPMRFGSNYTNKRAAENIKLGDEERWLEAELDENILAPEEHYARQKDLERMRLLLKKVNEHHDKKIENIKKEKDDELKALKKQMEDLHKKMKDLEDDD
ncbi:hypothetical protein, conserved [Angomonas deanei]|uniref:Uncharacterized protein n=1 Tax=Angomonas deanei TaxID=59799 RepID=A0A7G2CFJ9_9TRYP|nr:hypothetical protein, conserved [Angomonas deanei]